MKKLALSVVTFSTVAILSLGVVGCSSNNSSPETNAKSSVSASPTVVVQRSETGAIDINATELALKNEKLFSEKNSIIVGENQKFTVKAAGTIDKNGSYLPAENEQYYGFIYTSTLTNNAVVTYTINGVTNSQKSSLDGNGTIIISAPKDAKIIANIQNDSLTQTIDLNQGQRTSTDLAQAWYEKNTQATISNGVVSIEGGEGDTSVTFKNNVTKGEKTAFMKSSSNTGSSTNGNEFGWAGDGKKTWIVIDGNHQFIKNPSPNGGSLGKKTNKFTLKDSKGNSYELANKNLNIINDDFTLVFLVPNSDELTYTLIIDAGTDITRTSQYVATISGTSPPISIKF